MPTTHSPLVQHSLKKPLWEKKKKKKCVCVAQRHSFPLSRRPAVLQV
jgi:hypothetical protein